MITVKGIPRYDRSAQSSKYFVVQLMCMLSCFYVTVAKELPMQQVPHQKATRSNVSAARFFLIEYCQYVQTTVCLSYPANTTQFY